MIGDARLPEMRTGGDSSAEVRLTTPERVPLDPIVGTIGATLQPVAASLEATTYPPDVGVSTDGGAAMRHVVVTVMLQSALVHVEAVRGFLREYLATEPDDFELHIMRALQVEVVALNDEMDSVLSASHKGVAANPAIQRARAIIGYFLKALAGIAVFSKLVESLRELLHVLDAIPF